MKKMRKNNKGFSLVELIVVVLIMAIIAVALAPQVMKWVGTSKESTDISNYDALIENIQIAMTESTAITDAVVTITGTNTTISGTHKSQLATALNNISSYNFDANQVSTALVAKDKDNVGTGYVITIAGGKISRTNAPGTTPTPEPANP